MPYTATLYQHQDGRVKALIWTGSHVKYLHGDLNMPMQGVSEKPCATLGNYQLELESWEPSVNAEGFSQKGDYLIAEGMAPRAIKTNLSEVQHFSGVVFSGDVPFWYWDEVISLCPSASGTAPPYCSIASDLSLVIGSGSNAITLRIDADKMVRGQITKLPEAVDALILLWLAKQYGWKVFDIESEIDLTENISKTNPLLKKFKEDGWCEIEDLAAELGLIKKQIRMSAIGMGDTFF